MKKQLALLTFILVLLNGAMYAQNENVIPVQVKETFAKVSLTQSNGELIELPNSGRNTMLIFIRGKVQANLWCPICHYQYLEIMEILKTVNIAKLYDVDTYFVMPYSIDSLKYWIDAFPKSLEIINGWKNPAAENANKKGVQDWKAYADIFFSKDFKVNPAELALEIPVLFDTDQTVSKGLYLFKTEWGGTEVEQNIPTVYIIDKDGKVKFKYHSQYTNDRPDAEYLVDYIKQNLK